MVQGNNLYVEILGQISTVNEESKIEYLNTNFLIIVARHPHRHLINLNTS